MVNSLVSNSWSAFVRRYTRWIAPMVLTSIGINTLTIDFIFDNIVSSSVSFQLPLSLAGDRDEVPPDIVIEIYSSTYRGAMLNKSPSALQQRALQLIRKGSKFYKVVPDPPWAEFSAESNLKRSLYRPWSDAERKQAQSMTIKDARDKWILEDYKKNGGDTSPNRDVNVEKQPRHRTPPNNLAYIFEQEQKNRIANQTPTLQQKHRKGSIAPYDQDELDAALNVPHDMQNSRQKEIVADNLTWLGIGQDSPNWINQQRSLTPSRQYTPSK